MNIIEICEANYEAEYEASKQAIRDFLYMYFEIAADCLPTGDFDRADLGKVDPFRYLDIEYQYKYQFRSPSEIKFMHEGAAVNLLCRLAIAYDVDEASGSTVMADFNDENTRRQNTEIFEKFAPDLFKIHDAFESGRITETPAIQRAFRASFSGPQRFYSALEEVLKEVIFRLFESLYPTQASSLQDSALLRSYLAQGRDYCYFIGFPLDAPTEWIQVQAKGQALYCGGAPIDLDSVTAFLVVYPNGEVLDAQREFFPLPEGIKFVEPASIPKQDVLDPSILDEGKTFVRISFSQSPSRPNKPGYYSTSIHNISDKKLRVTCFAAFTKTGAVFRLSTISGDYFSADEFISWYGAPRDGWIMPSSKVTDPNNYGGGNGYWVYYFETEEGQEFAAGARIPK